jgi:hypothetical protein
MDVCVQFSALPIITLNAMIHSIMWYSLTHFQSTGHMEEILEVVKPLKPKPV